MGENSADRVDRVIARLLKARPSGFRNKHLAAALGVSRPRASQIIASRLRSGALKPTDDGPGPYVLRDGPGEPHEFWKRLHRAFPRLFYVALRSVAPVDLRTRHQARTALRGIGFEHRFVVIDLDGIASISDVAWDELLRGSEGKGAVQVTVINAGPGLTHRLRPAPPPQSSG